MIDRRYIQKTLVESAADAGLAWPPTTSEPVPLDSFMENLGVMHQSFPDLSRLAVSRFLTKAGIHLEGLQRSETPLAGFIFAQPGQAFAFVNQNDILTRQRFSAAHELGHFLLHFRPIASAEADFFKADDQEQFSEEEFSGAALEQVEREANEFAAELLMPEEMVRQRTSELAAFYKLNETVLSNQLATEFLVSKEAMLWRLKNLQVKIDN